MGTAVGPTHHWRHGYGRPNRICAWMKKGRIRAHSRPRVFAVYTCIFSWCTLTSAHVPAVAPKARACAPRHDPPLLIRGKFSIVPVATLCREPCILFDDVAILLLKLLIGLDQLVGEPVAKLVLELGQMKERCGAGVSATTIFSRIYSSHVHVHAKLCRCRWARV